MTIEEINKKHAATIEAMRKQYHCKREEMEVVIAGVLRCWCADVGVKDTPLLSLDDALSEAAKLLAPKNVEGLSPMPWKQSSYLDWEMCVYDANGGDIANIRNGRMNDKQLLMLRDYIISCGTEDVRLIVESGLAPVIAKALRDNELRRFNFASMHYELISLPETKR